MCGAVSRFKGLPRRGVPQKDAHADYWKPLRPFCSSSCNWHPHSSPVPKGVSQHEQWEGAATAVCSHVCPLPFGYQRGLGLEAEGEQVGDGIVRKTTSPAKHQHMDLAVIGLKIKTEVILWHVRIKGPVTWTHRDIAKPDSKKESRYTASVRVAVGKHKNKIWSGHRWNKPQMASSTTLGNSGESGNHLVRRQF